MKENLKQLSIADLAVVISECEKRIAFGAGSRPLSAILEDARTEMSYRIISLIQ